MSDPTNHRRNFALGLNVEEATARRARMIPYSISEAAQVAAIYGYFVTQGNGRSIFIQRTRHGDSIALIREDCEIVPYADDYNAQDHLVAVAVSGGPAA